MQYEKQDNEALIRKYSFVKTRGKMINRIGAVMIAIATGLSLIMVIRALGGL
jgi:hypothetical protein|tara:strand:+ start:491 stop:646 length:156 start_codon:yes stop_codon:yes gene_type:complete